MDEQATLQLKDLVGILRRRAWVIAITAGLVSLAAVVLCGWLPNQYEATSTILVEPQIISPKLIEPGVQKSDLNTRLDIMTMEILSRSRLSRIIDDFHLYPELSQEETRDEVIDYMRDQIDVQPVVPELQQNTRPSNQEQEINTFQINYRNHSPQLAAAVANRLANDYIDEHIKNRVQVASDTSQFIGAEIGRLQARIQQVDAKIAKVKADNVGSLPENLNANQTMLQRTLDNLRAAQQSLAEAQSDEAFYKQQALNAASETGGVSNDPNDPATRLQALEIELGSYRAKGYTDKHPDVIAAQQEIASLKKKLAKEGADPDQPSTLAEQNARAEQQRAALRANAAKQEVVRLQKQVDAIQAQIDATPHVAEQLNGLETQEQQLTQSYEVYSAKQQDASVAANMEQGQKGEQFRVLEAAVLPTEPASPNRILILALGLFLGLATGAGVGLLAEVSDESFHDARSLQQSLRIPVLAAVPAILLDADRRAWRRRLVRRVAASAVVVVLALGSAAGGYVWMNGVFGSSSEAGANAEAPASATPAATPSPAAAPSPAVTPPLPTGTAPPAGGAGGGN